MPEAPKEKVEEKEAEKPSAAESEDRDSQAVEPNFFAKLFGAKAEKEEPPADPALVKAVLESEAAVTYEQLKAEYHGDGWTNFKLGFALPWRRFKKESALVIDLKGEIGDTLPGGIAAGAPLTVPGICECLKKAALDPRINGLVIRVSPLQAGWAKLQEIRRYIELFKQSGKFTMAYVEIAGEKEYYIASACTELYVPPSASLSLRGLSVSGTFLRGVLEKVGVEPEVRRIGNYKSAGDQILRKDMSEYQREQLTDLLDDIWNGFLGEAARYVQAFSTPFASL